MQRGSLWRKRKTDYDDFLLETEQPFVVVLAFPPPPGLVLNAFPALLLSPQLWCGQVITHKLHNETSLQTQPAEQPGGPSHQFVMSFRWG